MKDKYQIIADMWAAFLGMDISKTQVIAMLIAASTVKEGKE